MMAVGTHDIMLADFISHPACGLHDMGPHHPECPARLHAIADQLIASGLQPYMHLVEAPAVSKTDLLRVHTPAYVEVIERTAPAGGLIHLDPDTAMNAHSLEAAERAAGAVVLGTDHVLNGEASSAFCNVRPPGHHASRDRAMGFCIFNNVAVGVAHALEAHGLERVAIVDFDAHHGNGTEEIFRSDPRVLLVSTFQHPFYPYSGADSGSEHILNVPLPAGTDGPAYRKVFSRICLPALERFRPQMFFFSAGFDAHAEDDMAMLRLTDADYHWLTAEVKAVADRCAQGRMVSTLEGGYALSALGRSAVAHIRAMIGL
jgi:acetoin utilization deacetylase AcuC-like enzyme